VRNANRRAKIAGIHLLDGASVSDYVGNCLKWMGFGHLVILRM
jgi:hypothetical protein